MKNIFSTPAIVWILFTAICIAAILIGLKAVLRRMDWEKRKQTKIFIGATISIVTWAVLLLILSYQNFFSDFSKLPPRPALVILLPLPFIIAISFSKNGKELLRSVPSHWLVFMQSFRIGVELLLLAAFIAGKIPVQMTFEGRNFDILTGLLALPVGFLVMKKHSHANKLIVSFNIIGVLLLFNILVIAILSMPTPLRYFMNDPANTLVAQFPFILLPGVLVPIAYSMHIFSLRQLFVKRETKFNKVAMLSS
jgi:uncharacterized membrane protein